MNTCRDCDSGNMEPASDTAAAEPASSAPPPEVGEPTGNGEGEEGFLDAGDVAYTPYRPKKVQASAPFGGYTLIAVYICSRVIKYCTVQ